MKKNIYHLLILCLTTSFSFSQIPVEKYRAEISQLNTDNELREYWNRIDKIDQEILVNTTDIKTADSISVANMIKTALIFEIHGIDAYKPNNHIPITNLSHNYIGKSQIAFWPIIELCAKVGGVISSFGGNYPAYELECVSQTFYNYSLINQEPKYSQLLGKLSKIKTDNIVDELLKAYEYQNNLRELSEVKVLHNWSLQSFKNRSDEGVFSFVKMSDDNIYLKRFRRIQKLELVKKNDASIVYRLENEPFGWSYIYRNDGSLTLIDSEKNELIKYTLVK
ncbi:hypothetical protein [uncultured Kordia sp.]|uniref:hypothetical protein n=1 Tax=uncultured Kordia sp. TaxID=507699 RepID=UPI00260E1714|nr:hypothetical protein [uncultured Kordia sp.]